MKATPFKGNACSTGASIPLERKLKTKEYAAGGDASAENKNIEFVPQNTLYRKGGRSVLVFKPTYQIEEITQDVKNRLADQFIDHLAREIAEEIDHENLQKQGIKPV